MSTFRDFVDSSGQPWRVYAVSAEPTHAGSRKYLPPSYQNGWLVFESPRHKFRLAPIPKGWERASVPVLLGFLGVASQARPRAPDHGSWPDEREDAPLET